MRRLFAVTGLLALLAAISLITPSAVSAGGGCHGAGRATAMGNAVELRMNCMDPRVAHASVGKVTFTNRDAVTHNVIGDGWGVDELAAGDSFAHDFVPGTHVYSCTLHPGMIGVVVAAAGVGTPAGSVDDATPVRSAASTSTQPTDSGDDRLPLGLAIGAVAGGAATIAVRRLAKGATGASINP